MDYDRSTLDQQYDLRARVPDVARHLAHRERESARVRAALPCQLDVAYGDSADERLDIFPTMAAAAPALIYIHGGYRRGSDKSDTGYVAPAVTGAGIAFVTINYALCPAVAIDDIVRQCQTALAWVYRNAGELGIDADRLFVAGHSAGGHLTTMMMATEWSSIGDDLPNDLIKGACATSGIYDLEPIRLCFLNDDLRLDEAAVHRNSPIQLTPRGGGRLILAVGALETDEYHRQQSAFVDGWRFAGLEVRSLVVPDVHHYNIVNRLTDPATTLFQSLSKLVFAA